MGGHGEDISQRHRSFSLVEVGDLVAVQEIDHRYVHIFDLAPADGDADQGRGHALGHRLDRVQRTPFVEGVPLGVVVVVWTGRLHSGVEIGVVIAFVAVLIDDAAVSDDQHAVDVSVLKGQTVVEGRETHRVHSLFLGGGQRPPVRWPYGLRLSGLGAGNEQQGEANR